MFKALSLTLITGLLAAPASADDCAIPGLSNGYLTTYFCGMFDAIVAEGRSRTIDPDDPEWPEGPGTEWLEIELLREAYRVDPRKTLELIERIRTAGGLPEG